MCKCEVCIKHKKFEAMLRTIPSEYHNSIQSIYDDLFNTSMDLDYFRALVDGSWPNSDDIILKRRRVSTECLVERRIIDPNAIGDLGIP